MTINGENALNTMDETRALVYSEKDLYQYLNTKKIEKNRFICLRIFDKEKRVSLKKIIELFTPPLIYKILNKIN